MEAMADNHLDSDEILEPGERKSRGALSEGTLPVQATHADREASRAAIDELALGATVEVCSSDRSLDCFTVPSSFSHTLTHVTM